MPELREREPAPNVGAIRRKLLAWFDTHRRDLPWRRTRDPYAVFLSEIMLQQTRVDTVISYFERFLSRFPTVEELARAPIDEVLVLWSGLGYYRRARSLHLAAREVSEQYGGAFPSDRASLEGLPGIGAYTAGAIASIAFGREEPIVDGNVARVLSRVFALDATVGSTESKRALWTLAADLVRGARPGDFNQSLMELGALICRPEPPHCDACPLRAECAARAQGRERDLPVTRPKSAPKRVALLALLAADDRGRFLLAKRSMDGLFGGLWEPPMLALPSGEDAWSRLARERATVVCVVEHVLTHRLLSVTVARLDGIPTPLPEAPPGYVELAVLPVSDAIGLSKLARKVLAFADASPQRERAAKRKTPAKKPSKKRVVSQRKTS